MGKKLQKVFGVGALALTLGFSHINTVYAENLTGKVFSETYMPSSGTDSLFTARNESRYSFSIDTKKGRKAIQVSDYLKYSEKGLGVREVITKESIDCLLEKGTEVEIIGISSNDPRQVIPVSANQICVVDGKDKK